MYNKCQQNKVPLMETQGEKNPLDFHGATCTFCQKIQVHSCTSKNFDMQLLRNSQVWEVNILHFEPIQRPKTKVVLLEYPALDVLGVKKTFDEKIILILKIGVEWFFSKQKEESCIQKFFKIVSRMTTRGIVVLHPMLPILLYSVRTFSS